MPKWIVGVFVAALAACAASQGMLVKPAAKAGPQRGKPIRFYERHLFDRVRTISVDDPHGAVVLFHDDVHGGGGSGSYLVTNVEELKFLATRWALPTVPTVNFATHVVVGISYAGSPCRMQMRGLSLYASNIALVKYQAPAGGPNGEDVMCHDAIMYHSLLIAVPIGFLPRYFAVTTVELAEDLADDKKPWRGYAFYLPMAFGARP